MNQSQGPNQRGREVVMKAVSWAYMLGMLFCGGLLFIGAIVVSAARMLTHASAEEISQYQATMFWGIILMWSVVSVSILVPLAYIAKTILRPTLRGLVLGGLLTATSMAAIVFYGLSQEMEWFSLLWKLSLGP
jgi:hypothetical protein